MFFHFSCVCVSLRGFGEKAGALLACEKENALVQGQLGEQSNGKHKSRQSIKRGKRGV